MPTEASASARRPRHAANAELTCVMNRSARRGPCSRLVIQRPGSRLLSTVSSPARIAAGARCGLAHNDYGLALVRLWQGHIAAADDWDAKRLEVAGRDRVRKHLCRKGAWCGVAALNLHRPRKRAKHRYPSRLGHRLHLVERVEPVDHALLERPRLGRVVSEIEPK